MLLTFLRTWVSVLPALRDLWLPLLILSASFHFLMFSLFLTFFPASWYVLLSRYSLPIFVFIIFSLFLLSYKFSLSVLSLAHFSYINIFLSLHLITNSIICIFIFFPSVAWLPLFFSFFPFPFIGAHLDSCINELVIFVTNLTIFRLVTKSPVFGNSRVTRTPVSACLNVNLSLLFFTWGVPFLLRAKKSSLL